MLPNRAGRHEPHHTESRQQPANLPSVGIHALSHISSRFRLLPLGKVVHHGELTAVAVGAQLPTLAVAPAGDGGRANAARLLVLEREEAH